jgi:hypothetical protein
MMTVAPAAFKSGCDLHYSRKWNLCRLRGPMRWQRGVQSGELLTAMRLAVALPGKRANKRPDLFAIRPA